MQSVSLSLFGPRDALDDIVPGESLMIGDDEYRIRAVTVYGDQGWTYDDDDVGYLVPMPGHHAVELEVEPL